MPATVRPGRVGRTVRAIGRRSKLAWHRARAIVFDTRVTRERLARELSVAPLGLDARVRSIRAALAGRLPVGPSDVPRIGALLAAHAPGQTERLMAAAAEAAARSFDLLGSGRRSLGRPIDWQTDFKSGYAWPRDRHYAAIAIAGPAGADVKVPWELSRAQHLPALAQAALLGDRDDFAREAVAQIREWIAANPPEYGVNWVCPMDVAIRAVNWLWAAALLSAHPAVDDGFYVDLVGSLDAHGRFIEANLEDPSDGIRTNHYLADLLGLLYIGACVPELARAAGWRAFARRELAREIETQVLPDGVSYESSVPYHRLAAEMFLSAAALEAHQGTPFDDRYLARLSAMLDFVRAYTKADGRAPQLGDADDGRLHVLSGHGGSPQDHRHLLAAGGLLFRRDEWWRASGARWTEALWFGGSRDAGFSTPPAAPAPMPSRSFPDGGVHILRHGDDMVVLSAGRVGTAGLGNHKHNDLLSIEVHLGGEDVLVDPGTYVYTADPDARNAFRSTLAHNTVAIDGVEQNEIPRSLFALCVNAEPALVAWEPSEHGGRVVAEHDGYRRLTPPVMHRRAVTLNAASAVSVEDTFDGPVAAPHRFTWTFAFAPGCALEPVEAGWLITLPSRRTLSLSKPSDEEGRDLQIAISQTTGFVSPSYGVKVTAPLLRWEWTGPLPAGARFALEPTAG